MFQQILNEKQNRIRDLDGLPPLPALGQQILAQVTNEHVDIPRLAKTIEQDPALFARIIGVANSAYFGCGDNIYTVSHAIIRVLGLCMVKSIALSLVLNKPFQTNHCVGFDMVNYWRRALLTAMSAQRLCRYVRHERQDFSDVCYLAGMLHNLGELVLVHLFPTEMQDVFSRMEADGQHVNALAIQEEIIGFNSFEAAAILARKWHLPKDMRVIYQHHNNAKYCEKDWQILYLVRLSSILVESSDIDSVINRIDAQHHLKQLGLTSGHLKKMMQKLEYDAKEVDDLAGLLAIE